MKIEQSGTPIRDTTGKKIGKYAPGVADMFASGDKFRVVVEPTWVKSSDKKALPKFLKLVSDGQINEALDLTFLSSYQNKEIKFGQICKPKVGANMGDTAEGVFAAAIACRFTLVRGRRGSDVTPQEVFKMLWGLPKRKSADKVHKIYEAPNKGTKIKDDVELAIHLAPVNLAFLLNRKSKAALDEYVVASCRYANSPIVKQWATTVYENGRYDLIQVRAAGVKDQKTTKVDVYVEITNDKGELIKTDIQVSLKIDDVKQFGQKGGVNFEREKVRGRLVDGYKEFFNRIFGITLTSQLKSNYNKTLKEDKDTSKAVNMVYNNVYGKLNTILNKTGAPGKKERKKLFTTIGNALEHYATLQHENVTLVQLSRKETTLYNFENLGSLLATHKFRTELKVGTSDTTGEPLPSILIIKDGGESDGKILASFRLKRENKSDGTGYYRNLVEKGPYLTELISMVVD